MANQNNKGKDKQNQPEPMNQEMQRSIIEALDFFLNSISSKEAGADALGITSKAVKKIKISKKGGITEANRKVVKAFGLDKVEFTKKNYKQILDKINEMTDLKEEMYQDLLKLNISTTGEAYELAKKIEGIMNAKLSWQEHVSFIKEYYPQYLRAAYKEQKIILETSFYEEEEPGVYCVEVEFPEWIKKGLFMDLSYSFRISSEEEAGSNEWENEIKDELYFYIIQELRSLKNVNFKKPENELDEFDCLRKKLLEDLMERIAEDENMSWGQFTQLTLASSQKQPSIDTMENLLLLGSLMLDGRAEEAMKILETRCVSPELYGEYGLEGVL